MALVTEGTPRDRWLTLAAGGGYVFAGVLVWLAFYRHASPAFRGLLGVGAAMLVIIGLGRIARFTNQNRREAERQEREADWMARTLKVERSVEQPGMTIADL